MKTYKTLLLSFLILISVSSIFTKPGLGILSNFHNDLSKNEVGFVKYAPSTSFILSSILKYSPPNPEISLFHRQTAWTIYKTILYVFYLLSWLTLLYLAKGAKKNAQISFLDISIAYFGSVSIILSTLGLSFFDIFAVPFFLLSISFLNKKKHSLSALFYLLAVSFNWTLLILFPIYFAYIKKGENNNPLPALLFLFIPAVLTILAGVRPLSLAGGNTPPVQLITLTLLLLAYVISIGALFNKLFFEKVSSKKKILISLVISSTLIIASVFIFNTLVPAFLLVMVSVTYYLYKRVISETEVSLSSFITICLGQYLSFLILTQSSGGNLIWPVILGLIYFIFKRSQFSFFQLLSLNILVFIKLFAFWSISGTQTVRGSFFEVFQYIFTAVFIFFSSYYVIKVNKFDEKEMTKRWKIFVVILLVLLNFSLIPAGGTGSDTFSWNQIAVESVRYVNPFRAHAVKEIDHLYPPLSTVIIGTFANLWKNVIGPALNYRIATKLSIITFYALSIWAFMKFKIGTTSPLGGLNKLLIILTTFALIIQTQGFADINIYIVPTLVLAILALFKKRYLLSGLLLGITVSIKWQPIILLPLFGATILDRITIFDKKKKFPQIFRNVMSFIVGFIICPIVVWSMVYLQPGGSYMMGRSFNFILHGAAGLSGQALNLNWIATYILHIVQPAKFLSLVEVENYNRIIPADSAPKILQGYFFLIVAGIILLRYWLFIKKNINNFLKGAFMIFLSHHILNKSAYDKHLFYSVVFMLLIYLIRPTEGNKKMLILVNTMTVMNLVLFFGITGPTEMNRLFFGIDITVIFAILYVIIYFWILKNYLSTSNLPLEKEA